MKKLLNSTLFEALIVIGIVLIVISFAAGALHLIVHLPNKNFNSITPESTIELGPIVDIDFSHYYTDIKFKNRFIVIERGNDIILEGEDNQLIEHKGKKYFKQGERKFILRGE